MSISETSLPTSFEPADSSNNQSSKRMRVTASMLRDHFHLPLYTVAKKFSMCTTAFKKMCRRLDIPKWPHRQLRGIDKRIAALKAELAYTTSGDRKQFLSGITFLQEEKARLAQGLAGVESVSDQSHSRSPSSEDNVNQPGSEGEDESDSDDASAAAEDDREDAESHDGMSCLRAITEKELRESFHLPLHTVAKKFGMCTTAFKKMCRRFGIAKWPHRQLRGIDKKIASLRAELTYSSGDVEGCKTQLRKLEEEKARLSRSPLSSEAVFDVSKTPDDPASATATFAPPPRDSPLRGDPAASSNRVGICNLLCEDPILEEKEEFNDNEGRDTPPMCDAVLRAGVHLLGFPSLGTSCSGAFAGDAPVAAGSFATMTESLLREHFHLPLQVVAKKFGMCTTAFKKLCRRLGVAKWPHRQLRGLDKKIAALRAELGYSTGDREVCWRSLQVLEDEKARLSRANHAPPSPAVAGPLAAPPPVPPAWAGGSRNCSPRSTAARPPDASPSPFPTAPESPCRVPRRTTSGGDRWLDGGGCCNYGLPAGPTVGADLDGTAGVSALDLLATVAGVKEVLEHTASPPLQAWPPPLTSFPSSTPRLSSVAHLACGGWPFPPSPLAAAAAAAAAAAGPAVSPLGSPRAAAGSGAAGWPGAGWAVRAGAEPCFSPRALAPRSTADGPLALATSPGAAAAALLVGGRPFSGLTGVGSCPPSPCARSALASPGSRAPVAAAFGP